MGQAGMGQKSPHVRRRGSLAGAAVLALAACSSPAPSGQPPVPSSAYVTAGASAATPVTTPEATPAGGLGGFGSTAEACGAVSSTVLSVLVLPMAGASGKDASDVGKAKEALAKMPGQLPAELKVSFDKLKSMADDVGQDVARFNRDEFDRAIAPIDAWLQANC